MILRQSIDDYLNRVVDFVTGNEAKTVLKLEKAQAQLDSGE